MNARKGSPSLASRTSMGNVIRVWSCPNRKDSFSLAHISRVSPRCENKKAMNQLFEDIDRGIGFEGLQCPSQTVLQVLMCICVSQPHAYIMNPERVDKTILNTAPSSFSARYCLADITDPADVNAENRQMPWHPERRRFRKLAVMSLRNGRKRFRIRWRWQSLGDR
jgi:hypothetical protein